MLLDAPLLSVFTIIKLVLADYLFSRTLPRREPTIPRAVGVLLASGALSAASLALGFSVFPTLTDDLSFFSAILVFVGVLAVMVLAHLVVYDCSPWTAIFCCSMSYLLESLSSSAERAISELIPHTSFPPPLAESLLNYWLISAAVFALAYQLLIRRIEKNGLLQISDPVMVVTAALTGYSAPASAMIPRLTSSISPICARAQSFTASALSSSGIFSSIYLRTASLTCSFSS